MEQHKSTTDIRSSREWTESRVVSKKMRWKGIFKDKQSLAKQARGYVG